MTLIALRESVQKRGERTGNGGFESVNKLKHDQDITQGRIRRRKSMEGQIRYEDFVI